MTADRQTPITDTARIDWLAEQGMLVSEVGAGQHHEFEVSWLDANSTVRLTRGPVVWMDIGSALRAAIDLAMAGGASP